jgi:hypothetical protein
MREFGLILRHGERIDALASGDIERFDELMRSAEEGLREGRYFWAERRFNRALRFVPGHPMATAGLAHTQLGAGLYRSAGLTLRSLFTHQPEMIDATYDPALLPNPPRLQEAVTTMEARLRLMDDPSSSGFLLAYLGRVLGERELVERGLDALAQHAPGDPLLPLLEEIWLHGASAPKPASDPAGK